jgi:hypothetical protein
MAIAQFYRPGTGTNVINQAHDLMRHSEAVLLIEFTAVLHKRTVQQQF